MQPQVNSLNQYLNPLKSMNDVRIEKLLVGGTWYYQQQEGDCKNTHWTQEFHSSKFYKSSGSRCLLEDSFSLNAESWHVKDRVLYIVNLSPREGEDVLLKYGVALITPKRLVLTSGNYRYPFLRTQAAVKTGNTPAKTTPASN